MLRTILATISLVLVVSSATVVQGFHRVTVIDFNVENLFDTVDDPANTGDDAYLPLSVKQSHPDHEGNCRANNDIDFYVEQCINLDWSERVLDRKLAALAGVIAAAEPFPDILIISETENPAIVSQLNDALSAYRRFLTLMQLDSTSVTSDRGIDVAIVSRLPLAASGIAHTVDFGDDTELCRGTRDITEAPLTLPDGKTLHVFGVHLPTGGNPFVCRS